MILYSISTPRKAWRCALYLASNKIYLEIYDGKTDIDYVHYFNVSFLGKWPLKLTSRKISSEKWGIHFSFLYSNFLVDPQEVEDNKN